MPNEVARGLGIPREDIPDQENAAWLYLQAVNALPVEPEGRAFEQQYSAALKDPWGPAQDEEFYAWFQKTEEARELFRKAAAMPRCQFPVLTAKAGQTFLAALMMPQLSAMRQLARLMAIEGRLLEQQGKVREALELYLAAFRMGGHLGREPILITGLVGIACQGIGCKAIRDCLARHDMQKDVLAWLAGELGALEGKLPDGSAWIAGERAMAVQIAGMAPDEALAAIEAPGPTAGPLRSFMKSRAFHILWPDRTIRRDFDRFYNAVERLAQLPPWECAAAIRRQPEEKFVAEHVKDWNVLPWMLVPAFERAEVRYIQNAADFSALRLGVALRLYRADHAAYPDTLDALAPDYLAVLPPDPFSGQGFHYRREADGWVLWSVGPDQDDDAGREGEARRGEDGDLVYRPRLTEGTQ